MTSDDTAFALALAALIVSIVALIVVLW